VAVAAAAVEHIAAGVEHIAAGVGRTAVVVAVGRIAAAAEGIAAVHTLGAARMPAAGADTPEAVGHIAAAVAAGVRRTAAAAVAARVDRPGRPSWRNPGNRCTTEVLHARIAGKST